VDVELAVGAAEMIAHRLRGDEQRLRDLAVGPAVGGQQRDA
jgi:hypothetical protein